MDAVFSGEFFEISFIYNGTQVEDLYNFFLCMKGKTVQTILKYHFSETKVFMRSTM